MNDTLSDYVDAWVGSLPDVMQLLGRWLGDVFVNIMTAFQETLAEFWAAVTYLATFVSVFLEVLANYPPEIWLLALIAPAIMIRVIPALTAVLAARLTREVLTPTPPLVRGGTIDASSGEDPYREAMTAAADVDRAGNTAATVIEVIEVLDADGNRVGWRVVLPSTQDWQELGPAFGQDFSTDQGALNDLDSNLALMLTPSQQAAYERAVYEAMVQAGVGPDDPVMLTGWSQGGILAGTLASDPDCPFNIAAIFVSGSPIDAMNIPDSVAVLAVQHSGDVVPTLDGPASAPPHNGANWRTLVLDPPPIDPTTKKPYDSPHHAGAYTETAASLEGRSDPVLDQVRQEQSMFFSENERRTRFTAVEP
jgi:hypothetical protein